MPNRGPDNLAYNTPYNFLMQSNGMVAIKPPFSFLTAYDMNTGAQLYRIANGESWVLQQQGVTGAGSQAPRGGPVATAGGLLFVGTAGDRTFRAREAATGQGAVGVRARRGDRGRAGGLPGERARVRDDSGGRRRACSRRRGRRRRGPTAT